MTDTDSLIGFFILTFFLSSLSLAHVMKAQEAFLLLGWVRGYNHRDVCVNEGVGRLTRSRRRIGGYGLTCFPRSRPMTFLSPHLLHTALPGRVPLGTPPVWTGVSLRSYYSPAHRSRKTNVGESSITD